MVVRAAQVPALRQRRAAVSHPVQIAGVVLPREHLVDHVRAPVFAQHVQHIFRAENAVINVPAVLRDALCQALHQPRLLLRLQQMMESHTPVRGLACSRHLAGIRIHKIAQQRRTDLLAPGKIRVVKAQHTAHFGKHPGAAVIAGGIRQGHRRFERAHVDRDCRAVEGCAPVSDAVVHDAVHSHAGHKIKMAANERIIPRQNGCVSRLFVQRPGQRRQYHRPVRPIAPVIAPAR